MRKLTVLFAAVVLAAGLSSQAGAATLTLQGNSLSVIVSALPPITIGGGSGPVVVSSGDGSFTEASFLFGPTTVVVPRTLFTGVSQISGLTVVGAGNGTKVYNGTAGTAVGGVAGTVLVNVLQFANLNIPLSVVGNPGSTAMAALGSIAITVIGQGWTSGTAVLTGVTTTTPGTAVLNTITLMGSDSRTAGHAGNITLVTAFKAITNVAGTLPGFAIQSLTFVPEPGTLLLLGSGVVGLAVLGRRRMRK